MIDLARYSEKEPVSISSIAMRQDISERYLEQLVGLLKKAGLVRSIRGATGGYVLMTAPMRMDFPAPVSPVRTLIPASSGRVARWMTATFSM